MKCAIRVTFVATIGVLPLPRGALGQDAEVIYDHRPGVDNGNRHFHLLSGERRTLTIDASQLRSGLPSSALEVPKGGQACFLVVNANPLLYTYSLTKKAVTVEAPAGLGEIITGASSLLKAAGFSAAAPDKPPGFVPSAGTPPQQPLDLYAAQVTAITQSAERLEAIKRRTDGELKLDAALVGARQERDSIEKYKGLADATYTNSTGATADKEIKKVFQVLRVAQQTAVKQAEGLVKEIEAAATSDAPRLCAKLEDSRLHFALVAAPKTKPKDGEKAGRPVDTVAQFDADPVSTDRFAVVPTVLVGFGVTDAQRFSLKNNVIARDRDRRPIVSPGAIALARVGDSPIWGAVGISKGRDMADGFLGLVFRGGPPIIGSQLMVGAGLTLARVVVDIKSGKVGEALPVEVKKLDDLFIYEYRTGASVTFSVSGLTIGGSGKEPTAKKPEVKTPD